MREMVTDWAFIRIVQDGSQTSHRRTEVQWLDMCQHLLNCFENLCYDFFRVIIAVDETWIRYTESMEWKHPQSPIKRKFNIQAK